jgi:hypothetical protein
VWLDRSLTPGVALTLPPEDEWVVPWPPHDRELGRRQAGDVRPRNVPWPDPSPLRIAAADEDPI